MLLPPDKIILTEDKSIRVDGHKAFRLYKENGIVTVQFCDQDRYRSRCRGSRMIEIPLEAFINKLKELSK
jgi:hypothetical protein